MKRIEDLPQFIARRLTEQPCRCEECRLQGLIGWPVPMGAEPHHYLWCCSGHALKKIRLGYYAKRKAAFRQPSRNSTRPRDAISAS